MSESAGMSLNQLSQAFATMLGPASDAATGPLLVIGRPDLAPDAAAGSKTSAANSDESARAEANAASDFPVSARAVVEAMLFVGRPDNLPVTSEQMAGLIRGTSAEEIDEFVRDLNADYAERGSAYRIISDGAGYRMTLQEEFTALRQRLLGRTRAARLSAAAIEVLALVAYNESLTAGDVTRLRGTPSGHILRQLVRRRLLRLESADAKPGKAKYFTTSRFLEVFRLQSLEDLPQSDDVAKR